MIHLKEIKKDNYLDQIQPLLRKLQKKERFDRESRAIKAQLCSLLKKKQYIRFSGNAERFIISKVGDSYLYDVPVNKRGHLSVFRGHRIRIICIASGRHFYREYMAGFI
jgi:hypothetical protein